MSSDNIPNAVIGGILTAIGTQLFNKTHKEPLNFSEVFWTLTTFRQKYLVQTLPLISGIFIASGILFDWMKYQSFGKMNPFGPSESILMRSSMYSFATAGFCQGLGSKLIGGDLIFFGVSQIAKRNCMFLPIIIFSFAIGMLLSLLLDSKSINILSNPKINPKMEFKHIVSANITIGLGVILTVVTILLMKKNNKSWKTVIKTIASSFFSGILVAFGYGVCGLANRNVVFNGLTAGTNWDPVLLLFMSIHMIATLAIHNISKIRVQAKQKTDENLQLNDQQNKSPIHHGAHFLIGGILIGIGWGMAGLDIVAYLMHSAIFTIPVVIIFGCFLILGTTIGHAIKL